ncbi:MAG: hypothetical protein IAE65_06460 [Ignavibacteria bacterium]|nr:hypothetical protein [Ignavibacteria bacterium]HCN37721.1 hypothetical protein [Bacteroidota bacterium]
MIPQFSLLNEEEQTLLMNAPALIAILVAGADKVIDDKEINWAEKMTHFRASKENWILHDYYYEVSKTINDSLKDFIENLPNDAAVRTLEISNMLRRLNHILPKIDSEYALELYESYLSYAEAIAKSSGGILGMSAISPEEKELMKLSMIDKPAGN